MGPGARFRYRLQPILHTRQWDLDGLLLELQACNGELARRGDAIAALEERSRGARAHWNAAAGSRQALSVDGFVLITRYLGDLAGQIEQQRAGLGELTQARDALSARVMQARRGVEAVEKHRDGLQRQFVQTQLRGEFNLADDQWNTLPEASDHDDS
jgi:flagellar biosynthesis chaperone FliJ